MDYGFASQQNLKWRKANKMDTILQEDWTEFHDKYPYYLDTFAKNGSPSKLPANL